MGHTHDHASRLAPSGRRDRTVVALIGLTALVAVLTVVGMAAWWPRGDLPESGASVAGLAYPRATVADIAPGECLTLELVGGTDCDLVTARLTSGPDAGQTITFQVAAIDFHVPELAVGDHLILQHNPLAPPQFAYAFWEFQRELPLAILTVLFVVAVVLLGRWQGVRAMTGLVVTFGIIVWFLLPSLLQEQPAAGVALVAASLIAFSTLYLAHGVSLETTVALVGTLVSLVLIATLAALFVALANLTGLSGDDVQLIRVTAEALDPAGLLLAGIIIGALGVLDDVTVTQTFAVAELRAANPTMSTRELYRRGVRVGREHIAATVNTLVLAYVGASLSLMLFFVQSERSVAQVIGQEAVAIEIVRTLVGSLGLIAAVPVTTALAAAVGRRAASSRSDGDPGTPAPPPEPRGPRWQDFAPEDDLAI